MYIVDCSVEKYTAVLQQSSNRFWHIPAADGTEWLCMGDSTLPDAVCDDGNPEDEEDKLEDQIVSEPDTSETIDLNPHVCRERDASHRTTVTISRRNKPKTTNVITVHTIPTTASAARADLQQKKFMSDSPPPSRMSRLRTKTHLAKHERPSSNYSSKYIEDGS